MRMTTHAADDGAVPEWTLGDRLRKARELTGLEVHEFADEIGIHRNSVGNYERGRRPRPIVLKAWALRSGVSAAWLETGQMNSQANEGYLERSPCPVYTLNNRRTGR